MVSQTKFTAADASLGYAYQVRCSLLYALSHIRHGDAFDVSIEALDDVAFLTVGGSPTELLQLKHSLKSKSNLTDASPDLWKTLRIWAAAHKASTIGSSTRLFLISTATALKGSAAALLRNDQRDIDAALAALNATATSSVNKANTQAYGDWQALTELDRLAILEQIEVIDGAPTITSLDADLTQEVWGFTSKENIPAFLEYLEGWWFPRVVRHLADTTKSISSAEIEGQLEKLREEFQRANLPIDEELLKKELDVALAASYQSQVFVRQLELVSASAPRVGIAIRDYFRAYEQRSRWIRQDLILDMELESYESRLCEEWELAREQLVGAAGSENADEVLKKTGLALLTWAENNIFPIRANVTVPFVSRGSFHMLANEMRVGWHPKFKEKLASVLQSSGGESS